MKIAVYLEMEMQFCHALNGNIAMHPYLLVGFPKFSLHIPIHIQTSVRASLLARTRL